MITSGLFRFLLTNSLTPNKFKERKGPDRGAPPQSRIRMKKITMAEINRRTAK